MNKIYMVFYADIMQAKQAQLYQWLFPILLENQVAYEANDLDFNQSRLLGALHH